VRLCGWAETGLDLIMDEGHNHEAAWMETGSWSGLRRTL
jgi:hypothetical protein